MDTQERKALHTRLAQIMKTYTKASEKSCVCVDSSGHLTVHPVPPFPGKNMKLIAYVRSDGDESTESFQKELIDKYCLQNGYKVLQYFIERGKPASCLHNAIKALRNADGLVIVEVGRVVEHATDRLHELRPFIHHFLCDRGKHLISIEEGIDTSTSSGQTAAIELINSLKDVRPAELSFPLQ